MKNNCNHCEKVQLNFINGSFFFQELHYNLTCKNYDYFFKLKLFSDFKNRYSFSFRLFSQNNLKFEYKNLLQSKIVGRHAFFTKLQY